MLARSAAATRVSPKRTATDKQCSRCSFLSQMLRMWNARNRQRHALRILAERDDYLLKDIGLTQDAAIREAQKPFWQR